MNHYAARQRESDQRWDYTCRTGQGRIYPVGYCGGYREYRAEDLAVHGEEDADRLNAEQEPFRDRYHTDGHETEAEARDCYRRYLLDRQLRLRRWEHDALPDALHLCDAGGCTTYTEHEARIVGWSMSWHLCEEHLSREVVEDLLGEIGEAYTS